MQIKYENEDLRVNIAELSTSIDSKYLKFKTFRSSVLCLGRGFIFQKTIITLNNFSMLTSYEQ